MTPFILIAVLAATPDGPLATADQVAPLAPADVTPHWYVGVGPRTAMPLKGSVGVAGVVFVRYRPLTALRAASSAPESL